MKKLPVKLAKDVLKEYNLSQVIVLCRDKNGVDHFITYGENRKSCKEAAISADRLKLACGWPPGSLSEYVRKCAVKNCEQPMPHIHNPRTGCIEI